MLKALNLIVEPGSVVELRALNASVGRNYRATIYGFFDNYAALADCACNLDAPSIYFTPNPVRKDLLARAANRTIQAGKDSKTTSDADVVSRRWFLIDIDPKRLAGVSSTDAEHEAALSTAAAIRAWLAERGWPAPIMADSGNGAHLLYRVDFPNTPEATETFSRALKALARDFDSTEVTIDPSVHNASRIWKLYGTMARKGDSIPDRPHRWARILEHPDTVELVPCKLVSDLAVTFQPPATTLAESTPSAQGDGLTGRVRAYLAATPGAVSGQNGDSTTYRVACQVVCDFGLPIPDALPLMMEWNRKCVPPWTEEDILAKLKSAKQSGKHPVGNKVVDIKTRKPAEPRESAQSASAPVDEADARARYNPGQDTDLGNADRLIRLVGKNIRYTVDRGWLVWDGRRWKADQIAVRELYQTSVIPEIYREICAAANAHNPHLVKTLASWAKRAESNSRVDAAMSMACSKPDIYVKQGSFDANKWLFNVQNGTIDLRTGMLAAHNQTDLITRISPATYDPGAKCPLWLKFLNRIFDNNQTLIAFLQTTIGYSLTGSTEEQIMMIAWGTGKNGKSVCLDTISDLMGDYATETPAETLMIKRADSSNSNDVARLAGARFVSANETEEGQRLAEAKVKGMTGGDTLTARFLHREFFEFKPEFKIWMRTNHKPQIRGTDEGIWRRLRLIPFNVTIPEAERDPKLTEKLRAEMSGILNWALEGCLMWQKNGLKTPPEVMAATTEYRKTQDILAAFLSDCCVIGKYYNVTFSDLYKEYEKWCDDNGEKPLSNRKFSMILDERGLSNHRGTAGARVRYGLRLRNDTDPPPEQVTEVTDQGLFPVIPPKEIVSSEFPVFSLDQSLESLKKEDEGVEL